MLLRTLLSLFRASYSKHCYPHTSLSNCVVSRKQLCFYTRILPSLLLCQNVSTLHISRVYCRPWRCGVLIDNHSGRSSRVFVGGRSDVIRKRGLHSVDTSTPTTVSVDWGQEIFNAYVTAETDGIIQLSESCNNPLEHLNPIELWQETRQAAQRIAVHVSSSSTRKKNQKNTAPEDDNKLWRGPAASMLNGWIAACSLASAEEISSSSSVVAAYKRQQMAQYALDLFDFAIDGEAKAPSSTNHPSHHKPRATEAATTVTPDLVTYSVMYTTLYPVDSVKADKFLQLAIRQSKKVSGTQRRKLLNTLGKNPSLSVNDKDSAQFFRDREMEIRTLLATSSSHPESPNSIQTDVFVLHETENFVVLNKPSGVSCYHTHVTTSGKRNQDLSLVDSLMRFCNGREQLSTLNPDALGIVHRLDRGTSGCIVVSKNDPTHARLVSQLFTRQMHKTYTVLVSPAPSLELYNTTGNITIPVHGKPAKSMYTILERYTGAVKYISGDAANDASSIKTAALINVTTFTGRQHQVRVHCAHGLGAPVVGDELYRQSGQKNSLKDRRFQKESVAAKEPERFHLHASSIFIPCLNKTISAPLPNWWSSVLDDWRGGARIS